MDLIRRALTSVASVIAELIIVSIGAAIFIFGSVIFSAVLLIGGIASIVGIIAYGIYDSMNDD